MKRTILLCCITILLLTSTVFALDKFLSYRNLSPIGDEYTSTTPDTNFAIKQGYIYTNVLAANVAESVTVPTGAKFVIITSTANLWVKIGGVATVPSGDTTNNTGSELNPSVRYLGDSTTIGIISESAAKVSLVFYE